MDHKKNPTQKNDIPNLLWSMHWKYGSNVYVQALNEDNYHNSAVFGLVPVYFYLFLRLLLKIIK